MSARRLVGSSRNLSVNSVTSPPSSSRPATPTVPRDGRQPTTLASPYPSANLRSAIFKYFGSRSFWDASHLEIRGRFLKILEAACIDTADSQMNRNPYVRPGALLLAFFVGAVRGEGRTDGVETAGQLFRNSNWKKFIEPKLRETQLRLFCL